jgi:DNA polymerase III delta subunit
VLSGDDLMSRARASEAIIAAVTTPGEQLTHITFDPTAEPLFSFVENMMTPSMFAGTRLFHIRHAGMLTAEDLPLLAGALDIDLGPVYLLIEIDPPSKEFNSAEAKTKKITPAAILKALRIKERSSSTPPTALHEEFAQPRDFETPAWLVSQLPQITGRKISLTDAKVLVDRVGSNLDLLYSEIMKIDIYLSPKEPVTRAAIDHVTGALRKMTHFDLAAALGKRDFPTAAKIIGSLLESRGSLPLITAVLAKHFWALWRIRRFLSAHPEVARAFASAKGPSQNVPGLAIGIAAGLLKEGNEKRVYPAIILSGIVGQAHSFSDQDLSWILRELLNFDLQSKNGRIDKSREWHELQMLCYRIVRSATISRERLAIA